MRRRMFKSKIHRGVVTDSDLNYEGSFSIDKKLMLAADIVEFEEVHIWNVTNGARLTTYAIEAAPGSGVLCANGAAAHHIKVGDTVIIATFTQVARASLAYRPIVVRVDESNHLVEVSRE